MELSVIEQNGKKIYRVKDEEGFVREVTLEFVKFAIENGEIDNCYVDNKGNIFTTTNKVFNVTHAAHYKLLGKLFDSVKTLTGYLLQQKATNKVVKASIEKFNLLVEQHEVDGAFINKDNELCLLQGIDEYQLINVDGKVIPRKISNKKIVSSYTMSYNCDFSTVHDTALILENKLVRGTAENDRLGRGHKYPEIVEIQADGIVVQIDNVKIAVKLLNKQDIVDDIANQAELSFTFKNDTVSLKITDIDYRLNAFSLVVGVYLAYKKLVNNFAKLVDIMISGTDQYYWSAVVRQESINTVEDTIKHKTKSDINVIQEMYNIEKSQFVLDITPEQEQTYIRSLKLGNGAILINCENCTFTSTTFRLDFVNKEVYMKFQNNTTSEIEEIAYKGKNVDNLTPIMACIIAATVAAKHYVIKNISIIDYRTNNSFELLFKSKSSREVQTDLLSILNK